MATAAEDYYGIPNHLLTRAIDQRENRGWNLRALSSAGAVGLAQIKPIAVCSRIRGCSGGDKSRLAAIEIRLYTPAYNLCWGARILRDNLNICREDQACALAGYLNGEYTSRYVAEILDEN